MQQLIQNVKNLVGDGKLKEALQTLIEALRHQPDDSVFNETILLNAQLHEVEKSLKLGLIEPDKYFVEANRISDAVLSVILEQLEHPPAHLEAWGSVPGSGKLLHNIPRRMTVGVLSRCTVRIAADEAKLLEGFATTAETVITNIEMAKIMEVRVAPESAANFQVEELSIPVQPISTTRANEWKFLVTPLREGTHRLLLRVIVVEIIDEKEFRRDTILEQDVLITSDIPEAVLQTSTWNYGNVVFAYTQKGQKKGLPFWKSAAKMAAAAATVVGIALTGWLFLQQNLSKSEDPDEPVSQLPAEPGSWTVQFRYDEALLVQTVRVDGENKSFRRAAPGLLGLYVPAEAKVHDVEIIGQNGVCSLKAYISKDAETIRMLCRLENKEPSGIGMVPPPRTPPPANPPEEKNPPVSNPPVEKPPADNPPRNNNNKPADQPRTPTYSVAVRADAASNNSALYWRLLPDGAETYSGKRLETVSRTQSGATIDALKAGNYEFIIKDGEGNICSKQNAVQSGTTVVFDNCALEITLFVNDALQQKLQLSVNKRVTKNYTRELVDRSGPTKISLKVPAAGQYSFEIMEATHQCATSADITRSGQVVNMDCQTLRQKPTQRQVIIQLNDKALRSYLATDAKTARVEISGLGQMDAAFDRAKKQISLNIPSDHRVSYLNLLILDRKTNEYTILWGVKPADNLQDPLIIPCDL